MLQRSESVPARRTSAYRVTNLTTKLLCRTPDSVGRYAVENVSAHGVCLSGTPALRPGQVAQLFHAQHVHDEPALVGQVCWAGNEATHSHAGLRIEPATQWGEDLLQEILLAGFALEQEPTALVVTGRSMVGRLLRLRLATCRERAIATESTSEAIAILGGNGTPVSSVFLPLTAGGLEFASFLRAEFPRIRRVAYGAQEEVGSLQLARRAGLVHDVWGSEDDDLRLKELVPAAC